MTHKSLLWGLGMICVLGSVLVSGVLLREGALLAARQIEVGFHDKTVEWVEHSTIDAIRTVHEVARLFYSVDLPDEKSFAEYTTDMLASDEAIESIVFLRRIDSAQRSEYESLMRKSGKPGYRIHALVGDQSGETLLAGVHLPVCYVTTLEDFVIHEPGLDMFTHTGLGESLLTAIRTGEVIVSSAINNTLYFMQAIYARGETMDSDAEREQLATGVVLLQYDIATLTGADRLRSGMQVSFAGNEDLSKVAPEPGLLPVVNVAHSIPAGTGYIALQMYYPLRWADVNPGYAILALLSGLLATALIIMMARTWSVQISLLRLREKASYQIISDQADEINRQHQALVQKQMVLDEHSIVSTSDLAGRITYVNDKFCEISGYSREELIGQNHRIVKSDRHPPEFYKELWQTISRGENWQGEICNHKKNGDEYWVESTIVPFFDTRSRVEHYISIRTDITPLMHAKEEMQAAKLVAERANQAKTEFLSAMSHELRTPMNAIMGFSQVMFDDKDNPLTAEQAENLAEIDTASKHLLSLINEVLDLSRIEAGRMEVQLGPVSVMSVIEDCTRLVAPIADASNISINVDLRQCENMWVMADKTRLKQALINIFSNAIKYNNENGKVTFACAPVNNNMIRLSITDTGSGISLEDQSRIFSPFERLGASAGAVEGTGIGLGITRCLIELMQGSMGVKSVLGEGSCFWFDLPACVAVKTDIEVAAGETDGRAYCATAKDAVNTACKMLYVEDNVANRRLLELLMKDHDGVELITVDNGKAGLEVALSEQPDIVLLDINLPGMGGIEIMQQLRASEQFRQTPIIAISADAMLQKISRAIDAGFDDYITKPISPEKLFAVLDIALSRISKLAAVKI